MATVTCGGISTGCSPQFETGHDSEWIGRNSLSFRLNLLASSLVYSRARGGPRKGLGTSGKAKAADAMGGAAPSPSGTIGNRRASSNQPRANIGVEALEDIAAIPPG
jgi:hypothetical protein